MSRYVRQRTQRCVLGLVVDWLNFDADLNAWQGYT